MKKISAVLFITIALSACSGGDAAPSPTPISTDAPTATPAPIITQTPAAETETPSPAPTETPTPIAYSVPAVYFEFSGVVDRYAYSSLTATVEENGESETYSAQIKGRGNSTWGQPKSSYTVKFDEKVKLFGMTKSKHWAFVANYEDKSLLRNFTASYLAGAIGLESVMRGEFCDLYINGDYWGNYYVMEKVEPEPGRVPIDGDTGLLIEFDGHVVEVNGLINNNGVIENWESLGWSRTGEAYYNPYTDETFFPVGIGGKWATIKEPSTKKLTEAKVAEAISLVNAATDALKSHSYEKIANLLDVRSFVKYYIIEEYMNNTDSSMHSSVYMYYRETDKKLVMGPVWDFDRSCGNCDYWNPEQKPDELYNNGTGWWKDLFKTTEAREILKEEWAAFQDALDGLPEAITEKAEQIRESAEKNFIRWDILDKQVGAIPAAWTRLYTTYDDFTRQLTNYLVFRRERMDDFITNLK